MGGLVNYIYNKQYKEENEPKCELSLSGPMNKSYSLTYT